VTEVRTVTPAAPYKGLASYTEDDADLFFGRDREAEIILSNFKARRLTVVYGESGVGKSSLLRAGVAARLLREATAEAEDYGGPEFVPVVFSAWRDEPAAGLAQAVRAAAARFGDPPAPSGRLRDDIVASAAALDAYLLVMLDQFEEYFLYHPVSDDGDAFARELPLALNTPGLQASFILSIREDALAKLDRFRTDVPWLLDAALRVERLDSASARAAIVRPLERYSEQLEPVGIEPELVDAVLHQVTAGRVLLAQSGRGTMLGAQVAALHDRIETPYLQLVMTRLWDTERAQGSSTLRLATLDGLGGAEQIVRTHLDSALGYLSPPQRACAADMFHHLVTPSGAKIAHSASDLAEYAERPEREVHALLEKLAAADTRIIRPIPPPPGDDRPPRFEIYHDVLASSILDWRAREMERAARRRLLVPVAFAMAAGVVCVAIAVLFVIHRSNQADAAREAAAAIRRIAAFDSATLARYTFAASPDRVSYLFPGFQVASVRGARVEVRTSCAGCPRFTRVIGRRGTIHVAPLERRPFPVGTRIRLLVTAGGIGKYYEYTVAPAGVDSTQQRCRPPGSRVPEARLPQPCPRLAPRPQRRP
jgi:hypothetical protein